ncbi:hypothetical protein M758_11G057100, partial [Ceratodon purpureus]
MHGIASYQLTLISAHKLQTLHAALTLQQPHASPLLLLLARHRRHAALLLIVLQPLCPASTSLRFDMLSGRTTMAGPETRV